MLTIELEFKGPFMLKELSSQPQRNAESPGIYIWGFEDIKTKKFIPYYVGKSQGSIVSRIKKPGPARLL